MTPVKPTTSAQAIVTAPIRLCQSSHLTRRAARLLIVREAQAAGERPVQHHA